MDESMWDFFWEVRLQKMEGLGKREAILTASRLIRTLASADPAHLPLRLFEPGCGEAQIIGALVDGHAQECSRAESVGIDYLHTSIERCRKDYPGMRFIEGDFTDPVLVGELGQFNMLLLVNALHEVFSLTFSEELHEVDVPRAKERVAQAFALSVEHVLPGGYIVLFDGLETPGDITRTLKVRFLTRQAREHFDTFAREYHPFQIRPKLNRDPFVVELSWRDFTRYLTKSIFLGKHLWPHEKFESYQYYNEAEFRAMFARENVEILQLRTLTENYEKWSEVVEIEEDFPAEHIIIVGRKGQSLV